MCLLSKLNEVIEEVRIDSLIHLSKKKCLDRYHPWFTCDSIF